MALQALLRVDGIAQKDFYVLQDLNYEITKSVDNYKPTGNPKGGLVHFTILSPEPNDLFFYEWVLNNEITYTCFFLLPIVKGINHGYRALSCYESSCISLREFHSGSNGQQVYLQITMSTSKMVFGKDKRIEFNNNIIKKMSSGEDLSGLGKFDYL